MAGADELLVFAGQGRRKEVPQQYYREGTGVLLGRALEYYWVRYLGALMVGQGGRAWAFLGACVFVVV